MTRGRAAPFLQWLAFGLLGGGLLTLRPVDVLSSLAMVLTLLTGLKLWEARRLQERRLVCLLQLLSAGVQGAVQTDLAASLLQGAAVVVALAGLLALEVGAGLRWGVLLRRSAGVVVAALPLALVLFLLVPRLPPIGLLQGGWGAAAVTGLSDTLDPGSIATLATNGAPAARVTFAAGAPPPVEARQWRVLVHEEFDGARWTLRPEDPSLEFLGWRQVQEGQGGSAGGVAERAQPDGARSLGRRGEPQQPPAAPHGPGGAGASRPPGSASRLCHHRRRAPTALAAGAAWPGAAGLAPRRQPPPGGPWRPLGQRAAPGAAAAGGGLDA